MAQKFTVTFGQRCRVTHPLFHEPPEIKGVLQGVASQEGNDGPDYDLMVAAADYIDTLERLSVALANRLETVDPQFVKIVEDNFWELLA